MTWRCSFTLLVPVLALQLLSSMEKCVATNHFFGIAASNSVSGGEYTCRTQAQWNQLVQQAKSHGFEAIRIVGFDCNALDMASSAAATAGVQVMAGIYADSGSIAASLTQINSDVQTFRTAYDKYGAGRYVGLTIGNEVPDTPGNIMAKVNEVRNYLESIGISTPVSTTHTWVEIRNNPVLCGGDFVGANAHAFYDGSVTSSQAGDFLYTTVKPALEAACPGKQIYITETGWPSRGPPNNKASASLTDEQTALSNINCAATPTRSSTTQSASTTSRIRIFAFEYDDQTWKAGVGERSFGIFGKSEGFLEVALGGC